MGQPHTTAVRHEPHLSGRGPTRAPSWPTAALVAPLILGCVVLILLFHSVGPGPVRGQPLPIALILGLAPVALLVLLLWPHWVAWRRGVADPWRWTLWLAAAVQWGLLALVLVLGWTEWSRTDGSSMVGAAPYLLPWPASWVVVAVGSAGTLITLRRGADEPAPRRRPAGNELGRTLGLTTAVVIGVVGLLLAVWPQWVSPDGSEDDGRWCAPVPHAMQPLRDVEAFTPPSDEEEAAIHQLPLEQQQEAWQGITERQISSARDALANQCTTTVRPRLLVALGIVAAAPATAVMAVRGGRRRTAGIDDPWP
jgi:hypothetical protein